MISTFRFCIKNVTSNCVMNYSQAKEALMLQKMVNKGLAKKKPNTNWKKIISKGLLFSAYDNEDCSHRMTVLNKNYMENVNEILSKGECGKNLMDLGIEVTKVKICKGLNFLDVYFVSKNIKTPQEIKNEALKAALIEIQKGIGTLNYTRKVPSVRFVRDKRLENAIQIDQIFEVMDFGRDYKPVNEKKVVTSNLSTKPDSLPEMRQDVFGVDVTKIKEKISAEIIRFKTIDIQPPETEDYTKHEFPEKLIKFNKKEFFKFYKRRRIEELKRRKMAAREMDAFEDFEYEYDDGEDEFVDNDEEFKNEDDEDKK